MAIKFLSDIDSARNNTDINTDGVYQMNGTTVLDGTSTYTRLYNPEGSVCLYLGDGGDRTNYSDNNFHRFRSAGGSTDYMFINSNGNVGIGTTSPDSKAHIEQSKVTINTTNLDNGTAVGLHLTYPNTDLTGGEGIALAMGMNGRGRSYIANISATTNKDASDMAFYTENGGVIGERLRINSSGNVGIGTTSPAVDLHVADDVRIDDQLYVRSISSQYFSSSNNLSLIYGDAANFTVSSNATERMRITSDGKVGINNSNPHSELTVHGKIDTSDTNNGAFRIYNGSTFRGGWGTANWTGSAFGDSSSDLVAYVNGSNNYYIGTNGQPRLTVSGTGNVGIGTTSPSAPLHLHQPSSTGMKFSRSGHDTIELALEGSNRFVINNDTDSAKNLLTLMYDSGNVGIGTTSPSAKLHVAGAIKTTGDVTMSSNTTLHIGNVDLTTGSGGNTVSVECATSSGTAMNFKTSGGTVGAYMMYQGTTTTRFAGRVEPSGNRTLDLGTDALRWRVLYCETLDSAGQHESNLQDREQPVSQYITGTVLSWKDGKNRPCTNFADHMRMGIAVLGQDSPLVQGAEPVLCTGIVEEGDYLVTSEKEGHAVAIPRHIVKEQLLFDCVIGKALQDGEGESHLIKTWINI